MITRCAIGAKRSQQDGGFHLCRRRCKFTLIAVSPSFLPIFTGSRPAVSIRIDPHHAQRCPTLGPSGRSERKDRSPSKAAADARPGHKRPSPVARRCRNCQKTMRPIRRLSAMAHPLIRQLDRRSSARLQRPGRAWPCRGAQYVFAFQKAADRPFHRSLRAPKIKARCEIDLSPGDPDNAGKPGRSVDPPAPARKSELSGSDHVCQALPPSRLLMGRAALSSALRSA